MKSCTTLRLVFLTALIGALAPVGVPADAEIYTWNDPNGGFYGHRNNWDPRPFIMPGSNDSVRFDLNDTYSVFFNSSGTIDVENQQATFEDGDVTINLTNSSSGNGSALFDLIATNGTGLLVTTNPNPGIGDGTFTRLTIAGGQLRTQADSVVSAGNYQHAAQVTVSSDGFWNVAGDYLRVGAVNDGTVLVRDGGELRTGKVTLGENGYHLPYADGRITVTGAGSSWNTSTIYIGGTETQDGGFGRVTVQDDATVKASGTVKMWSDGDLNLNGGLFEVGLFDDRGGDVHWTGGTLRILNQQTVLDDGQFFGNSQHVYSGKRLEHRSSLTIGQSGAATLRIDGSGSALVGYGSANNATTLGAAGDADGSLFIDGSAADWNGHVEVGGNGSGQRGTGHLTVSAGAQAIGNLTAALNDQSVGEVDLLNEGTHWSANDVVIADRGQATLNVVGAARLSTDRLNAANAAGATAAIKIDGDGSVIEVDPGTTNQTATFGQQGTATLEVLAGGTLEMNSTEMYLADQAGSSATVIVDGSDGPSRWSTNRQVTIANAGHAELQVAGGGQVIHDTAVRVAEYAGSTANIFVTGDSDYRAEFLNLAGDGSAGLDITAGGSVMLDELVTASRVGGQATINVTGDEANLLVDSTAFDQLTLADQGSTALNVANGGSVMAGVVRVAQLSTASGDLDIRGAGSKLESRDLEIGYGGIGTMAVSDGATVNTTINARVGQTIGAQGMVSVQDGGNWTTGNLYLGGNDVLAGGSAQFDIRTGGVASVADTIVIWEDANVQLDGGTLSARRIEHTHGGQFNLSSGRLEVDDFAGELFNAGATLAPGRSIAVTRIDDDYFQLDAGTLEIELGGTDNSNAAAPQYDALLVDGLVIVDGTLDVVLADLGAGVFQPMSGDTFEILTAGTLFSGTTFSNPILPPLAAGLDWNVNYDYGNHSIWLEVVATTLVADFNGDSVLDGVDADAMVAEIVAATHDPTFDLTNDGLVDDSDLMEWLTVAGETNLASGNPYFRGDANLDGTVDGIDFIEWNDNKFTSTPAWTAGDFSADGVVDGLDFVIWNAHKFMTADGAIASVPEPTTGLLLLMALIAAISLRGRDSSC